MASDLLSHIETRFIIPELSQKQWPEIISNVLNSRCESIPETRLSQTQYEDSDSNSSASHYDSRYSQPNVARSPDQNRSDLLQGEMLQCCVLLLPSNDVISSDDEHSSISYPVLSNVKIPPNRLQVSPHVFNRLLQSLVVHIDVVVPNPSRSSYNTSDGFSDVCYSQNKKLLLSGLGSPSQKGDTTPIKSALSRSFWNTQAFPVFSNGSLTVERYLLPGGIGGLLLISFPITVNTQYIGKPLTLTISLSKSNNGTELDHDVVVPNTRQGDSSDEWVFPAVDCKPIGVCASRLLAKSIQSDLALAERRIKTLASEKNCLTDSIGISNSALKSFNSSIVVLHPLTVSSLNVSNGSLYVQISNTGCPNVIDLQDCRIRNVPNTMRNEFPVRLGPGDSYSLYFTLADLQSTLSCPVRRISWNVLNESTGISRNLESRSSSKYSVRSVSPSFQQNTGGSSGINSTTGIWLLTGRDSYILPLGIKWSLVDCPLSPPVWMQFGVTHQLSPNLPLDIFILSTGPTSVAYSVGGLYLVTMALAIFNHTNNSVDLECCIHEESDEIIKTQASFNMKDKLVGNNLLELMALQKTIDIGIISASSSSTTELQFYSTRRSVHKLPPIILTDRISHYQVMAYDGYALL